MQGLSSQIDPRAIVIHRDTRQRQENIANVDALRDSIARMGIINPIVVREEGDQIVLVAGERRLTAALQLGLTEVPIRNFADLEPLEAEIVELEENIKREDLTWRDNVRAIGRIHLLHKKANASWKVEQTAESVSLKTAQLYKILKVFDALDSPKLKNAEGIEQAYNTLHRFSERKAESVVSEIIVQGAALFGAAGQAVTNAANSVIDTFTTATAVKITEDEEPQNGASHTLSPASLVPPAPTPVLSVPVPAPPPSDPVICANFIEWIAAYNGPKFSLIHCDFPYGNYKGGDTTNQGLIETEEFYDNTEDVYWNLCKALEDNLDRVMSYSAHMIFWFNMNFYTETVARFRKLGLWVHDHPLIWHKTSGAGQGVVPGTAVTYPRRQYDTALLIVRGKRPLARPGSNSYPAPAVTNKFHPSQKPEPMLRHFLSMVVDETTTMLDPTCGSAAALRAAEDLGARSVLGLELDPKYAAEANTKTLQARVLRQAGIKTRSEELV